MYHVYNRGVDKQIIFKDERDYAVFLSFLKYALLPEDYDDKDSIVLTDNFLTSNRINLRRLELYKSVSLVSYCLMPNHFHLLLYQRDIDGITRLMRSIATGYVLYFNKRHNRVGTLFQGRYKASCINKEDYWQHISRYIHLNPVDLGEDYQTYKYSSYSNYIGKVRTEWLNTGYILGSFKDTSSYEVFVSDYIKKREEIKSIKYMLANQ